MINPNPYSIGSSNWSGFSKLIEEMGEVQQVIGKLIATGGERKHWDGSNLVERLEEELGDLLAAIEYTTKSNILSYKVQVRKDEKLKIFWKWHTENPPVPV